MAIQTVVSTEKGSGGEWQSQLLAWSFREAGHQGPLTIISAAGAFPCPGADHVFATHTRRYADGLEYPPYNKPYSLWDWLRTTPPAEETILVIDPDTLFTDPCELPDVAPGWAMAQNWDLSPEYTRNLVGPEVSALCRYPDLMQAVGVPLFIHRDDLLAVCPRWVDAIRELRRRGLPTDHWISEMTGYILATADLGIVHTLLEVDCGPILHYYDRTHCTGTWSGWDKRAYRPWSYIPQPPEGSPRVTERIFTLVNEYARIRRGETRVPAWVVGTPVGRPA